MTVKTNGATWKKFYQDPAFWPENAWHEGEEITVNGLSVDDASFDLTTVKDADHITVAGGVVYLLNGGYDGPTLEALFRTWLKAQATTVLMVEVDRAKLEAVTAAVKAAGGKVRK